ncbi:hypothetical protein TUM4438_26080 [Shewanella sairae]|uniref:Lipoprotein n=1 Tax=Shewanella sairae TaxID=190310 RepID=A0ABQ4PIC0_9GAMM|nr:hypothetical protein [Shewanella sairae]MCL1128421.1 hypothetical protein [Shewanella sairae]GIU47302.1 hypothetical protein TUM4438_26080 [Shewanella sairae]
MLMSIVATGCSSNSVTNAGCDFVSAAHGNAEQREQRQVIGGSSAASANNRDTEVGIINAILACLAVKLMMVKSTYRHQVLGRS